MLSDNIRQLSSNIGMASIISGIQSIKIHTNSKAKWLIYIDIDSYDGNNYQLGVNLNGFIEGYVNSESVFKIT